MWFGVPRHPASPTTPALAAETVVVAGSGVVGTELAGDIKDFIPSTKVEVITRGQTFLSRIEGAHELVMDSLTLKASSVAVIPHHPASLHPPRPPRARTRT